MMNDTKIDDDILLFRFDTVEHVVATVVGINKGPSGDPVWDIKSPALINLFQINEEKFGMQMIPWNQFVDTDTVFSISLAKLTYPPVPPNRDIRNAYSERFGSGIQIVRGNIESFLVN